MIKIYYSILCFIFVGNHIREIESIYALIRVFNLSNYSTDFNEIWYIKFVYRIQFCCLSSSSGIIQSLHEARSRYSDGLEGFHPRQGKIVLFSTTSSPTLGSTKLSIQCLRGAISPGVKLPGREADYSSPSSAEVKSGGPIPLFPYMSSWRSA
jgi:hypothetical protein